MSGGGAIYDGLAEWYDATIHAGGAISDFHAEAARLVGEALGSGPGRCLDVGCGTGFFIPVAAAKGWSVVGVDVSADQLRLARDRLGEAAELVEADATNLPFAGGSFDAVVAALVSTDIEPWEQLVSEAARVLRPGGSFVHVGLHACFVGPHVVRDETDATRRVVSGYRERERKFSSPAFERGGIRERVGAVHVPLDDLVNALVRSGLALEWLEEAYGDPPLLLAIRARKTP